MTAVTPFVDYAEMCMDSSKPPALLKLEKRSVLLQGDTVPSFTFDLFMPPVPAARSRVLLDY